MPKSRGFTLIELLVVISIISILSVIGFATYTQALKSSRDARRKTDLYHIQEALEQYYIKNGSYPVGSSGSDRECWENSSFNTDTGNCPLNNLVISGLLKSVPIDPGTNIDTGNACGTAQIYVYLSTMPSSGWGDGTTGWTGESYILGAVQETQGTTGCWNADSTEKCPMGWGLMQFCLTNKQ